MENMISNITRKYEEGWQICFIFYTKGKMDKIKYNPEMQNGAVDGWEVISEKIPRMVQRDNLFDMFVMTTVKKKPDLRRIQGELGNMLGMQLQEKTLEGRAT
ncbi:hypothetical protein JHK85_009552 [Glycine max]|nr:hypothetical protein JHK85_009552 [Glycine max]